MGKVAKLKEQKILIEDEKTNGEKNYLLKYKRDFYVKEIILAYSYTELEEK